RSVLRRAAHGVLAGALPRLGVVRPGRRRGRGAAVRAVHLRGAAAGRADAPFGADPAGRRAAAARGVGARGRPARGAAVRAVRRGSIFFTTCSTRTVPSFTSMSEPTAAFPPVPFSSDVLTERDHHFG